MLTHHEKRLCRLKAQGLNLKEISELTGLSYGTIRTYFSRIYKKLAIPEINMSTIREASQNQQDRA